MCGITGIWSPTQTMAGEELDGNVRAMTYALRHRGPDDSGTWVDASSGIGLGQTRLAIIDVSDLGHQPMFSSCGRYVVVFNGEIYNFEELRRELETAGRSLRGHSDTEVLVEGISQWGATTLLPRLNGMFAFAVWDRREHSLLLARDQVGIKPLFYGWQEGVFVFGSELKALTSFSRFRRKLNCRAVGSLTRFDYVPAPESIWQDIYKLPPGHMMMLRLPDVRINPVQYRRPAPTRNSRGSASQDETLEELEQVLKDAVKRQMVADVPLGAFLSGGVDSSLVVALMQSQTRARVRTFTIGFDETGFDESSMARRVAHILGTDHTEMRVTSADAVAVIPELPRIYDEPFADSSQIPTCLLARLTRAHVTVSLSGDGGDELFAGYTHYFSTRKRWRTIMMLPRRVRMALARLTEYGHDTGWEPAFAPKLANLLRASNPGEFYRAAIDRCPLPDPLLPGIVDGGLRSAALEEMPNCCDLIDEMVACDLKNYLPEDILTKVDRATMCVALEARVPLLDDRVVEFAAGLPMSIKMADGRGKWPLRYLLAHYLPLELIERPKMGFRIPIADWLRGPLRDWAEDLLAPSALRTVGIFGVDRLREIWRQHRDGVRNAAPELWSALMFQAWAREWRPTL